MAPVPIGEIEGNDQFLTDLVIDCSCERFPRKLEDWERLGRALGANSVIQSLSLVCHPNAAYEQEIKAGMGLAVMVRYMAKNRCIDSLSIQNLVYTADTTSGDVFFMCLSKFTRDNYSLAHLELIELSTSGDFHYHMLAKGILESRSIRQLSVKDTRLGYCSFGILAQACKSSLKRLDLSNSNVNLRRLQLLVGSWAMDKVSGLCGLNERVNHLTILSPQTRTRLNIWIWVITMISIGSRVSNCPCFRFSPSI